MNYGNLILLTFVLYITYVSACEMSVDIEILCSHNLLSECLSQKQSVYDVLQELNGTCVPFKRCEYTYDTTPTLDDCPISIVLYEADNITCDLFSQKLIHDCLLKLDVTKLILYVCNSIALAVLFIVIKCIC